MEVRWVIDYLKTEDAPLREHLDTILAQIDDTVGKVRHIAHELRPGMLDHFGLGAALETEIQTFAQRSGIACSFTDETGSLTTDLQKDCATALFRIAQEALTNVARHAEATHLAGRMALEDGNLVLEIRDDGRGISAPGPSQTRSLGFLGMRERIWPWGGSINLLSTPGEGTCVRVNLPFPLQVVEPKQDV
jgi:signal transduction histidine kinase